MNWKLIPPGGITSSLRLRVGLLLFLLVVVSMAAAALPLLMVGGV